jgi:hypothetical protein
MELECHWHQSDDRQREADMRKKAHILEEEGIEMDQPAEGRVLVQDSWLVSVAQLSF